MASDLVNVHWDPLHYCTPEELSILDQRFESALKDVTCLVFWTGVPPQSAKQWATLRGLPTLTMAMGPLYSDRHTNGTRSGRDRKSWSNYMKAASGRYAEYACCGDRQAIVLTDPPPAIYSTRPRSNYRHIEEPILRGCGGGSGTIRIDFAHPTVVKDVDFRYQVWPIDKTETWYIFFRNLLIKTNLTSAPAATKDTGIVRAGQNLNVINVAIPSAKMQGQTSVKQQSSNQKKAVKRHQVELKQSQAQEKKEAKRRRLELEQSKAQEKKEAL